MISFRWLYILFIGVFFHAKAQSFKPIDDKSSITFTVKNFGLNVNGTFSYLKGTIMFDPQNLTDSHFDVSVAPETLDTGIDLRDKHIKKEEYLDATQYSRITFKSTEITPGKKSGSYSIRGNISIKESRVKFNFLSRQK